MKKTLYFCLLFFGFSKTYAQTYLSEDFNFTLNDSLAAISVDNGWVSFSGGITNAIRATAPGLSFLGYANSGIGNAASMVTSGQDVYRPLSTSVSGANLYISFMINVTAAQTNGDYFCALLTSTSTTNFTGRTFIKSSGGGFVMGISKWTETVSYGSTVLSFNTPYLVVVKLTSGPGSSDDQFSLFVFPSSIPANEPMTPEAGPTASTATDQLPIGRFALRQGAAGNAATLSIDGIRVGADWNAAPLPVKYNSIHAIKRVNDVILQWSTASEINNSGFTIERSSDGKVFDAMGKVKGAGNSIKTKNYSFTDHAPANGINYYRLKQVDYDGKSEYSKVVLVNNIIVKAGIDMTTPNPFNDQLGVSVSVKNQGAATIELRDMLGKLHYSSNEILEAGNNKVSISTLSLPNGIYFVTVSQNGESFTQKVIKR